VLEAAKERWNWQIDVVCGYLDQNAFRKLVGPDGRTFSPPPLLQVQPWENDAQATADLERRMGQAETVTGVPIGRVILAGSHSVGRAYTASVRHPPRYRIVQRVLADNAEPYRIVRRLFNFAEELLEERRPELVLAYEFGTPSPFAIRLAGQRRGIPCAALRYSKINSEHMYWTSDKIMLNARGIEAGSRRRKSKLPASESAKSYIENFRNQPRVIGFVANKWRHRMKQNFFRWHLTYAMVVAREIKSTFSERDKSLREPAFGRLFRYYRSLYLSYRQKFLFKTFEDDDLASMKYIYFPLHKEAELAQMYQATLWHNQVNTVRILASVMPMGYRLLIREHRLNNGQRPTRYWKDLAAIPNVTVIDPFDSQFKYLRNAALIVTENGSSGWEGLLLKKRVLLLSRTFYDGAGLGTKAEILNGLNVALFEALDRPPAEDDHAYDDNLAAMIDGESETTFATTPEALPDALKQLVATVGSELATGRSVRLVAAQ
jgi:hypothetical protein